VPVNLRGPGELDLLGNRFGLVFLDLPVGVRDPYRRLLVLKRRMDDIKDSLDAPVTFGVLNVLGFAPTPVEKRLGRFLAGKTTAIVTNVPGPRATLPGRQPLASSCSGCKRRPANRHQHPDYHGGHAGDHTDTGLVPTGGDHRRVPLNWKMGVDGGGRKRIARLLTSWASRRWWLAVSGCGRIGLGGGLELPETLRMEAEKWRLSSVVIEKDEDGAYVASVPTLRAVRHQGQVSGCSDQADQQAIELCLEVEEPLANEFIGVQRGDHGMSTISGVSGAQH
jgi:predicted RNase H-like HicB family nuclease